MKRSATKRGKKNPAARRKASDTQVDQRRCEGPRERISTSVSLVNSGRRAAAAEEAFVERHRTAIAHLGGVSSPAFIAELRADGTPEIKRDPRVDEELWRAQFAAATGSNETRTQNELMLQAYLICGTRGVPPVTELSEVLTTLREAGPKDATEGRLAAQMVCSHKVAMDLLARGSKQDQPIAVAEFCLRHAEKLMRLFGAQVESLSRYRGKGPSEQRVTVEHVHIHEGGQAVVGNIAAARDRG